MSKLVGFIQVGLGLWTLTQKPKDYRIIGIAEIALGVMLIAKADELRPVPPDSDFDPLELARGIEVELEHTTDRQTAKQIAKHHILEDPQYYEKLATIHLD